MSKFSVNSKFWIGIDLAKDTFDVSISPLDWDSKQWKELPVYHVNYSPASDEGITIMNTWIQKFAKINLCEGICVESTGKFSHRFAQIIEGKGFPAVSIINPKRSKDYGESLGILEKTDHIDAAILALYGSDRHPKPLDKKSEVEMKLQELNRMRVRVVKNITQWKNRINDVDYKFSKDLIKIIIQQNKELVKEIEDESARIIKVNESLMQQVKWIQQIPGIGPVNAITITAEFGRLDKYSRNKLVAAAGLYPTKYSSGKTIRKEPKMAKGGGAAVRRVLYMAAMILFSFENQLMDGFGKRLIGNGKSNMSVIGAMMRKLLVICRAVVVNGGVYDETKISRQKVKPIMDYAI